MIKKRVQTKINRSKQILANKFRINKFNKYNLFLNKYKDKVKKINLIHHNNYKMLVMININRIRLK